MLAALLTSTRAVAADDDGDGYAAEDGDCDDTNPEVHPFATERCANGIDDNCNAIVDETHSWSFEGYLFLGADATPVSTLVKQHQLTVDELKYPIGFLARTSNFHLSVDPGDCIDSLQFDWFGDSAYCSLDSEPPTTDRYEIQCGSPDTGPFVIEVWAFDASGNLAGFDTLVLEGRDVVPETLWLSVNELQVGRQGCLDAYFDNDEEIVFEVLEAPGIPRIIIEPNGDVVACFTPERRGEAEIVVRGEDGEGNVLEARTTVFVRGCATNTGAVSGAAAILAALLIRRGAS